MGSEIRDIGANEGYQGEIRLTDFGGRRTGPGCGMKLIQNAFGGELQGIWHIAAAGVAMPATTEDLGHRGDVDFGFAAQAGAPLDVAVR